MEQQQFAAILAELAAMRGEFKDLKEAVAASEAVTESSAGVLARIVHRIEAADAAESADAIAAAAPDTTTEDPEDSEAEVAEEEAAVEEAPPPPERDVSPLVEACKDPLRVLKVDSGVRAAYDKYYANRDAGVDFERGPYGFDLWDCDEVHRAATEWRRLPQPETRLPTLVSSAQQVPT